jgi:hypothetical protein
MSKPSLLSLAVVLASLCSANARADWRDVALPEDQNRIDASAAAATAALDRLGADAFGLDERPLLRALLDAGTQTAEESRLLGDWRCRSLQVSVSLGVFTYPAFRCRIRLDEHGKPYFEKLSGSQRRSGYLYANEDGQWVFLGARTVNDQPQRRYSANQADADRTREHDSVGTLEALTNGRLRMILDAGDEGVELYELRR